MAVEDYGGKAAGKPVEVVTADHQNKPDVGVGIARRWYDNENIDAIFDLPNSAIALAVASMSEQKNKVFVGSGAGTALLTGEKCTPNTVHWTYDTYAYGRGLGKAVVAQGGKKWFFITADYAFGHDLEKQATEGVKASGGEGGRRRAPSARHRRLSPRSCCRRRPPAPMSSRSPMRATTPSTRSSRRPNSG